MGYQSVVLATDGSVDAARAAGVLASWEWPAGTRVAVVGVCEAEPAGPRATTALPDTGVEQDARRFLDLVRRDELQRTERSVAEAAAVLREGRPGLTVEEVVRTGEPAKALLAYAREVGADLIVAGARGHGALRNLLLGSVSETLVSDAPCPVLIVRNRNWPATGGTVVVGAGHADDAGRLAEAALGLPLPPGTRFVALSVEAAPGGGSAAADPAVRQMAESLQDWAAADSAARGAASHLAGRLEGGGAGAVERRVLAGDVAAELLAAAAELDADLLVVGARERHGLLARFGLGSVSRRLVRRAVCAVLVVRGAEPVAPGAGPA